MPKEDVFVSSIPERYIFSKEALLKMPIISSNQRWDTRDSGRKSLRVKTFQKENGELSVSIAINTNLDGSGEWFPRGKYSTGE